MNLKEYIDGLINFSKENPDTLEMKVVTSKDAEGNGFEPVYYTPSKGYYEGDEFISHEKLEDYERDESDINAVCVN